MGARFGLKLSQIGTKWDKYGTYEGNFSVQFDTVSKLILNGPRFVQFGANLAQFKATSENAVWWPSLVLLLQKALQRLSALRE